MTTKTLTEIVQKHIEESPFDKEAIGHYDSLLSQVRFGVEFAAKMEILRQKAAHIYPTVDLRFLEKSGEKLRFEFSNEKENRKYRINLFLPFFAVYNLEDPYFRISGNFEATTIDGKVIIKNPENVIKTKLSDHIVSHLLRAVSYRTADSYSYCQHFFKEFSYNAKCEFTGLLPYDAKEKIDEARKLFGNNVFLIREAKNWDFIKRVRPSNDPLIIGTVKNQSYLIHAFNCTPIEMEVKEEFKINERNEKKWTRN